MNTTRMGLVGLGVMGRNLALNMAGKDIHVIAHDPWTEVQKNYAEELPKTFDSRIKFADDPAHLVAELAPPRAILIMVKAGQTVDDVINSLVPLLENGDILIDGGNSHYHDTQRRAASLKGQGLLFLGLGVSGGEKGARDGPSLMAGGDVLAYQQCRSVLESIAAQFSGEPCCALVGADGAGHFVKMVHNGIEYGIMQAIADSYLLLRDLCGQTHDAMAATFRSWNDTELASYLIEITAEILAKPDQETGRPLVEAILDKAEQKGTGRWSSKAAFDYAVPAPTIAEAVFARILAALKDERRTAAETIAAPASIPSKWSPKEGPELIRQALLSAVIVTYAQGFALIEAAERAHKWKPALSTIARIWRAGCIIRAGLLGEMAAAFEDRDRPRNLICTPYFCRKLATHQTGWRETVAEAVRRGLPTPSLSSALAYFDGYRSENLPANLIQAQRDYFGAHGYQRIDREGHFHTEW